MKNLEEMLKEMEGYGWTEKKCKEWFKGAYEEKDKFLKELTFEEYVKLIYDEGIYLY